MILSAMMFALGAFVSGLVWLVFTVALVRRARRLTERRLLASISTRRVEFETERDELRARHAMQMHRLEREVSRGLDMATAYRLEADIKERDLTSAQSELAAREDDYQELQGRLAVERDLVQDLERRHAEAGTMLRAVQHALTLEVTRRAQAQAALEDANALADRRRLELGAVRAQNEALRAMAGNAMPDENGQLLLAIEPEAFPPAGALTRTPPAPPALAGNTPNENTNAVVATELAAEPSPGGSVVPMPTRPRQSPADIAEQSASLVAEAARDLHRLAEEGHGGTDKDVLRVASHAEPRMPVAGTLNDASVVADLDAHRNFMAGSSPPADGDAGHSAPAKEDGVPGTGDPDNRFFEALAEIRALRRSAKQAGE